MTDHLDDRIRGLMTRMTAMVPDSPEYRTDPAGRPVAARRRVPGWAVAIAAGVIIFAAVAIPLILTAPSQQERPVTVSISTTSTTLPDPAVPPDAATTMEIHPATASPGATIELSFPEAGLRGVGYQLEVQLADRSWQPVAWLIAAAEGYGGLADSGPWSEDVVFPQAHVAGLDPDTVVLPDSLVSGQYRICDALGWSQCAELEVGNLSVGGETPECLRSAPRRPGDNETVIYVLCNLDPALPYPVLRPLADESSPITSTIESLVRGTTNTERQAGLSVGFDSVPPEERQRIQVTTDLDEDGLLHVDFLLQGEDWNPGQLASTSSQLISFIDPVFATAFQFPDVAAIDRSGMCWGESQCDEVLKRSLWEEMVSLNSGRRVGDGCSLMEAWLDPECRALEPMPSK